ncbi:ATP-binding protein [Paenibacillus sp. NPDC058174]|uniref:ATP-binding protein n=1 Tax=Paenibacillus sp. NPDC058174 TaxID=3346366 RepID=UPI0036DEE676
MNAFVKRIAVVMLLFILFQLSLLVPPSFAAGKDTAITVNEWQMRWETNGTNTIQSTDAIDDSWFPIYQGVSDPIKPNGVNAAWIKLEIPSGLEDSPGLLITKAYAESVHVYLNDRDIYHSIRNYRYDVNKILLPLDPSNSNNTVLIKLESKNGRIGIPDAFIFDDYQVLLKNFMQREMIDVILGSSFIFVSIIMFLCAGFVSRNFFVGWNALSVTILSVGTMIVTYSPFLYSFYGNYGKLYYKLFDVAQTVTLPAMILFVRQIFGVGPYSLIKISFRITVSYAVFCLSFMTFNLLTHDKYNSIYFLFSVFLFGIVMIASGVVLVWALVYYCLKKNKEAYILCAGLGIFLVTVSMEILWFYIKETHYELYLWKWGVVCFVISLIVILGKRIAHNYEQVVAYSKKLEMYNNELQRSEKMEIISQLAASVAHEVRNPLQVTRGFLQLLFERSSQEKEKSYLDLSINELDRASAIITDFLTFAKPQTDNNGALDIGEELEKIVGILIPLANLQGGEINLKVERKMFVRGNSSKFKQCIINIIKNSVEALNGEGKIDVIAQIIEDKVHIQVRDNGEGMSANELEKLGEPYFSKKTKGTGLGLMVSFRIIESMQGEIRYSSVKGKGTEVNINFPILKE